MNIEIKLTPQETKVVNYLVSRNNLTVCWEELAQFAKDPQSVKLKTIQKTVSEIKNKYLVAGQNTPFDVKFSTLTAATASHLIDIPKVVPAETTAGIKTEQTLVQIKRTPAGNIMKIDPTAPATNVEHPAHVDFVLEKSYRRVKTKYGAHLLNEREWDVMKHLHQNVGKVVPISELRDKVVYPQYGSKLPPRWFDHIKTIVGNIRAAVPSIRARILTVKGAETGYLFQ